MILPIVVFIALVEWFFILYLLLSEVKNERGN